MRKRTDTRILLRRRRGIFTGRVATDWEAAVPEWPDRPRSVMGGFLLLAFGLVLAALFLHEAAGGTL